MSSNGSEPGIEKATAFTPGRRSTRPPTMVSPPMPPAHPEQPAHVPAPAPQVEATEPFTTAAGPEHLQAKLITDIPETSYRLGDGRARLE